MPDTLDLIYEGKFLDKILSMKKQKPISLADAIQWLKIDVVECYKDQRYIEGDWNLTNFIDWLTVKGFHIELKGDEYDVVEVDFIPIEFEFVKPDSGARYSRHLLRWKPFKAPDMNGYVADEDAPQAIANCYRGTLLSKILMMPKQTSILFHDAVKIAVKEINSAFMARKFGSEPGHFKWYLNNFVEYIATLGFHIEFTGDEFELIDDSSDQMM